MIDFLTRRRAGLAKPSKTGAAKCSRCYGTGQYAHYGVCYRCGGARVDPTAKDWVFPAEWSDEQVEAWWKSRREASEKRAEKRAEKRRDAEAARRRRESVAADVDLPARQSLLLLEGERLQEMLAADGRELSERQRAFVLTLAQRALEKSLRGAPTLELGRQALEATLLKHDTKETRYGVREVMTLKAANGAVLWGGCPRSMFGVEAGETVTVNLTVEEGWADGCYRFKRATLKGKA